MSNPTEVQPPPPPPMSASPPRIIIIGAGSRGRAYGRAIATSSNGVVVAVAEPLRYKRESFGKEHIWRTAEQPSDGQAFEDWRQFVAWEMRRRERVAAGEPDVPAAVDAAFICVLDEMHREVVVGLAPLGLHIMCEKPLACSLQDCVDMYKALRPNGADSEPDRLFSIGHVLRYSPHNILLRKLLVEDCVIGDVCSVEHTEPVGWWHFTHSYVRGNWRNENTTAPSLLTKSCHDIDLLLWMLSSPVEPGKGAPHLPSSVTSTGALQFFKRNRKPKAAGNATNCLRCPLGDDGCRYSAKEIYVGPLLKGVETNNSGWPLNVVVPEIEDLVTPDSRRRAILDKLDEDYDEKTPRDAIESRNWFGRCVFESDNNVCDEQVVTMIWDDDDDSTTTTTDTIHSPPSPPPTPPYPAGSLPPRSRFAKTATLHMVAHTKKICERYTHIYGSRGEIYADSRTITVEDFDTFTTTVYHPRVEDLGHGGGDTGLTRQFVLAVDKVKNHGWSVRHAQNEFIRCNLEEVLTSHAMVFAAEAARTGKKVIDWNEWWRSQISPSLGC